MARLTNFLSTNWISMNIKELKNRNLILFECISGSKAYGLDTAASDTDIKGVFYLPKEQFFGLEYIPQVSNETNDEVYYELGRFVDLLIKNNPNILELLATPASCILHKHPIIERLRLDQFLSKQCKDTFGGYAITQIKKASGLNKKIMNPMERGRKSVIDFCYIVEGALSKPLTTWLIEQKLIQNRCGLVNIAHAKGLYALYYDQEGILAYKGIVSYDDANEVSLSSIPKGELPVTYLFLNKESYSSYCKSYKEYWDWVDKRNEVRYQSNREHGKPYDAKNMMHTIRLLEQAAEILTLGRLNVERPNREELLKIKAGYYDYDELMKKADDLIHQIEQAYKVSSLPVDVDAVKAERLLVSMREDLYR
ncbi:Predicted nucleotidyltransferase [Olivibacter domesticus]|uniref:Predicted nucleotidyltransferase n=2 Tax=Olivibacter domesticus TaxID=407022 RepID=A0A1H7JTF1_OLID1|nr:Predicted nucleotidyltransferase [Olivibacter domesticus]